MRNGTTPTQPLLVGRRVDLRGPGRIRVRKWGAGGPRRGAGGLRPRARGPPEEQDRGPQWLATLEGQDVRACDRGAELSAAGLGAKPLHALAPWPARARLLGFGGQRQSSGCAGTPQRGILSPSARHSHPSAGATYLASHLLGGLAGDSKKWRRTPIFFFFVSQSLLS